MGPQDSQSKAPLRIAPVAGDHACRKARAIYAWEQCGKSLESPNVPPKGVGKGVGHSHSCSIAFWPSSSRFRSLFGFTMLFPIGCLFAYPLLCRNESLQKVSEILLFRLLQDFLETFSRLSNQHLEPEEPRRPV